MTRQQDPLANFVPGNLVFLFKVPGDQPIDPDARDPKTNQPIYAGRKDVSRDNKEDIAPYDEKIDRLIKWCNEIANSHELKLISHDNEKKRVVHFPGMLSEELQASRRTDHHQADQKNHPPSPQPHPAFSLLHLSVVPGSIPEGSEEKQFVDNATLVELAMNFEQKLKIQKPTEGGITLERVFLNWLVSPGSERGGTGGPGGLPEPYRGRSDDAHPFDFSHKPGLKEAFKMSGEGVEVAILDTIPCPKSMVDAYERYYKVDPKNQKKEHLLIKRLLGPNSPLELYPASYEELLRMRAIHLRDHDYDMSDHGLFVAGIIHSIAPKAKIHLFEVLNSQGVGDLMSIAQGFWEVLIRFAGTPLVVNCSLIFRCPRFNQPIADLEPALREKLIKDWEKRKNENIKWLTSDILSEEGKEWLASQGDAIEWICDQLYYRGSRVIAAAGNDWKPNEPRPGPGYPAGFDSVSGTGALPKDALPDSSGRYPVSKYSNLSDKPEPGSTEKEVGIVTLGGEAGEGNGVLGIYIGQFPDMKYRLGKYPWFLRPIMWVLFTLAWGNNVRPRNDSYWAWWCGTSFATPIITGLTAAMLSTLDQPATTQDAIDKLYDLDVIRQDLTSDHEDGVEGVRQL